MQLRDGTTLFSATDLVANLECEHLTVLDFPALDDADMRAARSVPDEAAELIARKGDEHERACLQWLRAQGRTVVDIAAGGGSIDDKVARTLQAMHQGAEVIYQATLRDGPLIGYAGYTRVTDFIRAWRQGEGQAVSGAALRDKRSGLGVWSAQLEPARLPAPGLEGHIILADFSNTLSDCMPRP